MPQTRQVVQAYDRTLVREIPADDAELVLHGADQIALGIPEIIQFADAFDAIGLHDDLTAGRFDGRDGFEKVLDPKADLISRHAHAGRTFAPFLKRAA